jgi:hypothetical protein
MIYAFWAIFRCSSQSSPSHLPLTGTPLSTASGRGLLDRFSAGGCCTCRTVSASPVWQTSSQPWETTLPAGSGGAWQSLWPGAHFTFFLPLVIKWQWRRIHEPSCGVTLAIGATVGLEALAGPTSGASMNPKMITLDLSSASPGPTSGCIWWLHLVGAIAAASTPIAGSETHSTGKPSVYRHDLTRCSIHTISRGFSMTDTTHLFHQRFLPRIKYPVSL